MMKRLLSVVVLAVGGLVAFNFATTGSVTLIPSAGVSNEDRELRDLRQQFERAKQQFAQAHRAAAIGGVDTTGDVEATQVSVRRIEQDLAGLKKRLTSPSSIRDAEDLSRAVAEFSGQLR
jgi:hypothetical protein